MQFSVWTLFRLHLTFYNSMLQNLCLNNSFLCVQHPWFHFISFTLCFFLRSRWSQACSHWQYQGNAYVHSASSKLESSLRVAFICMNFKQCFIAYSSYIQVYRYLQQWWFTGLLGLEMIFKWLRTQVRGKISTSVWAYQPVKQLIAIHQ